MVLESIIDAKKIESNPGDMLILSFLVTLISIFISYLTFPEYSGIVLPLLITVTMTPLVYKIFSIEEEIEREQAEKLIKKTFWDRHDETIWIFTYFFIGNFLAIFLTTIFLPESYLTTLYGPQIQTIKDISGLTFYAMFPNSLTIIMINNLKVMFFSFLLSFLIGTGALFILSWNASILAIYLATFIRQGMFAEFLSKTSGIMPHAPVEIMAYFLAGIAGGILSVGIIRENLKSAEFRLVFRDSIILLLLAVVAVVAGSFLEVYV